MVVVPPFEPSQYYKFQSGKMYNGLTVVAYNLRDVNEGDSWSARYYDADKYVGLTERQRAILEAPNARYRNR